MQTLPERRALAKRLGAACGLVLLALSRRATARRSLRALAWSADLSLRELADVMGVEYKTVQNHLAGRPIAGARLDWYGRLEAIQVHGPHIHLVIRYRATPKRARWKRLRGVVLAL